MNKTTKGSLAAGAAAVLLLGGAGSLAYWTDAATIDGGTINSGYLTLDNGSCDAEWVYGPDNRRAGDTVVNFVPGDVVTKDCTFIIGAQGDNLAATPTVPDTVPYTVGPEGGATPAGGSGASFDADVAATYTLDDVAYDGTDPITEKAADQTLVATILVTIPSEPTRPAPRSRTATTRRTSPSTSAS